MEIKEFNIPVPWGHIAVKAWGNEKDTPVLVVHGLQDNAGVFDTIIPLLPSSFYYICIDLPSHGRSSRFPTKMLVGPIDVIITYKLVLDHFNRKKYILLGHSWGAQAFVIFTQLYPTYVLKLCLIDGIYPLPLFVNDYKSYWISRIDGIMKINQNIANNAAPSYTYNEAIDKLMKGRLYETISKETAECLLKRCLILSENGKYTFTTAPHLKVFTVLAHDLRYMEELALQYPLKCPVLLMKATAPALRDKWTNAAQFIENLTRHSNSTILEISGDHTGFSANPQPWATAITKFLITEYAKL